jgi:hypothetical protein
MGVTNVCETRFVPQVRGILRLAKGAPYPTYGGIQYAAAYPRHCERSEAIHVAA